jgi:hypothetical protein
MKRWCSFVKRMSWALFCNWHASQKDEGTNIETWLHPWASDADTDFCTKIPTDNALTWSIDFSRIWQILGLVS